MGGGGSKLGWPVHQLRPQSSSTFFFYLPGAVSNFPKLVPMRGPTVDTYLFSGWHMTQEGGGVHKPMLFRPHALTWLEGSVHSTHQVMGMELVSAFLEACCRFLAPLHSVLVPPERHGVDSWAHNIDCWGH